MPRFSIHSWNDDGTVNEPWMHSEVLDDIRKLMGLRTRLTPYLSERLARYRSDYEPAIRPTFYDFPDDRSCWEPTDDFMLGDALLVAPVVEPGATTRTVRLPDGADWRCGWSGETFSGGQTVLRPAPFSEPPFWVRVGFEVGI
jgi:alpha-glucosidase